MDLGKLFNPKSIAVVGASPQEGKVGNVVAKNLSGLGYAGEIYFVNPKYQEIYQKKSYKKLSELEKDVDLAIMAIPAESAVSEIRENCRRIKNYVVMSAGFSEIGELGKKREKELVELAKNKNVNILGPNCLGFIIPRLRLNASFSSGLPHCGNISFISQSGALAVAIMDRAKSEGLKFSNIVSIGNKTQIDESAMLEFLASDKDTKVIGMYLEGIKDGQKFIEIAKFFSKSKPIVVLKAGRSVESQQAISSHTGALSGSDDIMSAVFRKTGIIRAENISEFIDLLNLISNFKEVPSQKVTLITNAGGLGVLATDAFSGKKINLAPPEEPVQKRISEVLPQESSVKNPIDLLGDAKEDRYKSVLEIISSNYDPGTVICLLTPQDQTPTDSIAEEIINFRNKTGKNVITIFLGGERVQNSIKKLRENGVPNFSFPDSAVSALNKFYEWSQVPVAKKEKTEEINEKRKTQILKIIGRAKNEKRKALYFSESGQILEKYGIDAIQFLEIKIQKTPSLFNLSHNRSGVKFPAVLKVDSDKTIHKTEKEGVILDIKSQSELDSAIARMRQNFPGAGVRFIVQPMAKSGMELIIGIKKDEIFGPVIICGLGGIYTEIFKMADNLVLPLAVCEIERILLEGKIGFLFKNTRGKKPYDLAQISRIILGISLMASEIKEIKGFDINPIVIYNDGEVANILDIKILI